jgi:hypothetical protein
MRMERVELEGVVFMGHPSGAEAGAIRPESAAIQEAT